MEPTRDVCVCVCMCVCVCVCVCVSVCVSFLELSFEKQIGITILGRGQHV